MTWPSDRRTMPGGSLNPLPAYSPMSWMPSARRGRSPSTTSVTRRSSVVLMANPPNPRSPTAVPSSVPTSLRARNGPSAREGAEGPFATRRVLVLLDDLDVLLGVGVGDRVVGQHVRSDRGIHRGSQVRVDQRHRLPVGKLLAGLVLEFLGGQLVCHVGLLSVVVGQLAWSIAASCVASA